MGLWDTRAPRLELTDEERARVEKQVVALGEYLNTDEGKAAIVAASEKSKRAAKRRRKAQRGCQCCFCRRY